MKRFLLLLCIPLLLTAGCNKFDPSEIWDNINSLEQRVTALEELCKKMNTNINALQSLVSSIENRDYITAVTPVLSQDKTIGYTITFAKGNPITIYNGNDGKDGKAPIIGLRKDFDGVYYWTLNGEWLLDEDGNKVAAQGGNGSGSGSDSGQVAIPKLKIENNKWYVSYDNGNTWTELGTAIGPEGPQGPAGEDGDSIFQTVEQTSTSVIFVLADGTRITVPKAEQGSMQNPVTLTLNHTSDTEAVFNGSVSEKSLDLKVTLYYSRDAELNIYKNEGKVECTDFPENKFSLSLTGLTTGIKYYYFHEVLYNGVTSYSPVSSFETGGQTITLDRPANCYIISEAGRYQFRAVKGNGSESVGEIATAEVIWESFGTDLKPVAGDLVTSVSYKDGNIIFDTNTEYKEGNALIAAKSTSGKFLWSWHIWLTDKPEDHLYKNNAGTMMDRNLGATSTTPGDVEAIGLCYQWGRKDPFLGASSTSSSAEAQSTLSEWPAPVESTASTGTIEYAIENPTTFIKGEDKTSDWYYAEDLNSIDITRWQSEKTIYDPCPAGYRVPDGGVNGIWARASGSSQSADVAYDWTKKGINFGSSATSARGISLTDAVEICWYPNSGLKFFVTGKVSNDGKTGYYWSVTDATSPYYSSAYDLCLYDNDVSFENMHVRSYALYVRCAKE